MGARKPCRPSPRVSSSPPSSTSCPVRFSVAEEAARAQQRLVLRSSSKRPEALTSMIDCVAPLADRPPVDRSCAHNVISTRGTRMGRARSPFRGGTPEFPKKQESKRFFFFFFEGWPGQGQHDDDDRCDCGVSTLTHPSASLRCRPAGARMTNSQTKKRVNVHTNASELYPSPRRAEGAPTHPDRWRRCDVVLVAPSKPSPGILRPTLRSSSLRR